MRLFCGVPIKTAEVKPAKAAVYTWRERRSGTDLTEDVKGSSDTEHRDEVVQGERVSMSECVQKRTWLAF